MSLRGRLTRPALVLAAAAALLGGCGGGDGGGTETAASLEAIDPGPVHVHGLGVDPRDGALYIATHTGLYRTPAGETSAARVGERRQDTMGFAVAGPGRLIGSGHPDARDDLPPLLGLVESRDGGRTWRSVSLLGEADFHVLRTMGDRVYGFDSSSGRLYASVDGGGTWATHAVPEPLHDLVVDPAEPTRLVAAATVLYRSEDAGASWSAIGGEPAFLAWPAPAALFRVTGNGDVSVSADGGASWLPRGSIGGEPAAFLAVGERELYAAVHDGTVLGSRDGGETWAIRSRP